MGICVRELETLRDRSKKNVKTKLFPHVHFGNKLLFLIFFSLNMLVSYVPFTPMYPYQVFPNVSYCFDCTIEI